MEAAFQMGIEEAREGTVVCAESQTRGKGRLGRGWISPRGKGIYMSVILKPRMSPADVAQLTLMSAVAVCEAIKKNCQLQPKIKWPNDILIENKKVAGILTELSAEMDRVRFIVIGIGVNVNTPLSQLPKGATSIKNACGQKVARITLVQEILRSLEAWYRSLLEDGFTPVMARWKELSATLGRHVRVIDPSGEIEGEAVDLDELGGLIIRGDDGLIIKRMTGDVIQIG